MSTNHLYPRQTQGERYNSKLGNSTFLKHVQEHLKSEAE